MHTEPHEIILPTYLWKTEMPFELCFKCHKPQRLEDVHAAARCSSKKGNYSFNSTTQHATLQFITEDVKKIHTKPHNIFLLKASTKCVIQIYPLAQQQFSN